jgi:hypothetical protein
MKTLIGEAYSTYGFEKTKRINLYRKENEVRDDVYFLENDALTFLDFKNLLTLVKSRGYESIILEDGTKIQF